MTITRACRTIAEIEDAARIDGLGDPPLTQEQADLVDAILALHPPVPATSP